MELRTSDSRIFYTDSAGVVAFHEPDLMGKPVYFNIQSFGYTYPKNSMGMQSILVNTVAGGSAEIAMDRVNIAQRLYRVTGSGIYRDSILLGDRVPATQDDARVVATGMDTVQAVPYKGQMFWLWGDTNISAGSHGNFRTTCAVSELPGKGGLDTDAGIALRYFRIENYPYVKPMVNDPHPVIWLSGLRVARDADGRERLFANYLKVKPVSCEPVGRGIVEYDDGAQEFCVAAEYPLDAALLPSPVPSGPVFRYAEKGREYFYYSAPFMPAIRSGVDAQSVLDLGTYEAFTCLKEGERYNGSAEQLDRDADGRLRWRWKRGTSPLSQANMDELVRRGHLRDAERWFRLTDVDSGRTLIGQNGSVFWNEWRKRWICIRCEQGGDSYLGEIWYFEGDTPLGPWIYGRKVVSHAMGEKGIDTVTHRALARETYSFYNPTQHPEFDKNRGRIIYFEGTYSSTFSGARFPTPGYEYNQIMYRMDLDDPRLRLPVPVYRIRTNGGKIIFGTKERIEKDSKVEGVAFFAPDQPREGTVAVCRRPDLSGRERLFLAHMAEGETAEGRAAQNNAVFYAVPNEGDISSTSSLSHTIHLYEITLTDGTVTYSTKEPLEKDAALQSCRPFCRVWPGLIELNPLSVE